MKKPQINEASSLADRREMQYICQCLSDCQYYLILILHSQASRTPLRVSEAVQESSARIAKSYPDTPIALPRGGRITPIIYVSGDWAESSKCFMWRLPASLILVLSLVYGRGGRPIEHLFPLRKIARFVQGIALFKKRGLQ